MKLDKYIGIDLHQATSVVAVLDADGKVILETILAKPMSLKMLVPGGPMCLKTVFFG